MKELVIAIMIVITITGTVLAVVMGIRYYEDQYCLNTPWDRIDRERCGL